MAGFILKRFLYGIVILITVVVIITSIVYLAPVDPAQLTFGQRSDTQAVDEKRKALGLDQSLFSQMTGYLNDISPVGWIDLSEFHQSGKPHFSIFQFSSKSFALKSPDFRESYQTGRPVWEILQEAIPATVILAFTAIVFAAIAGIILGIIAALKQNTWIDSFLMTTSVLGYSMPSYIVAIMIAFILGYWLSDYTGLEVQGSLFELDDFGDPRVHWKNLILPAFALGMRPVALITQLTRSAMLDVMRQDFIRTAKAKGLSRRVIVFSHGFRNALNPVITAVSGWFAGLLAGAFFVEYVFGYQGLGLVTVNALLNFDTPVVLGCVLVTVVLFILINIAVDIAYAMADPRISINR